MTNDETKVKERPILFSGPMVRAILEGRKTQTRRVVKLQPPNIAGAWFIERVDGFQMRFGPDEPCDTPLIRCPYGKPGERLWVKETFRVQPEIWVKHHGPQVNHFAENVPRDQAEDYVTIPSIFMPRWASRLTLEIMGVRVQRVQEISEQDALAEGYDPNSGGILICQPGQYWFRKLWDSLNMPRAGCSWADNPWVWVLEFKRL